MRIKKRFSPWFDRDLTELFHLKNCIWRKAWHTQTQADWLSYRQMRIRALRLSRRPKLVTLRSSSLFVGLTPRSSGKQLKTWRINPPPHSCPCPLKLMMWFTDKKHMVERFNHHFIKSGFLFASLPVQHFLISHPF